ncbi:MAG: ABC-three component system protein [Gemmataceae bacterium]
MTLQQAYYESQFKIAFLTAKGEAFQTFFSKLMSLAHKGDFLPSRPWGNQGDRKNDGFLRSQRCLYQVYAPLEMTAAEAQKKIQEDFDGAIEHWGTQFDRWVFVHNAHDGLPPHVIDLMLTLEQAYGVRLESCSLEELLVEFRGLSDDDKASWFGPAPTDAMVAKLGFEDLQPVLDRLAAQTEPPDVEVLAVPMGKIEANALTQAEETILRSGMRKAPLVAQFLAKWHDETLGERLAEAFRNEYARLKRDNRASEIFGELQSWAGGSHLGSPEHQVAVWAIMAYFFERCDIFEAPRSTL